MGTTWFQRMGVAQFATIVAPIAALPGVSCGSSKRHFAWAALRADPSEETTHMHDPGLNFDLGDTIDSLRSAIQDFAANEIAPRAADIDRDNLFPHDLWQKLGEL